LYSYFRIYVRKSETSQRQRNQVTRPSATARAAGVCQAWYELLRNPPSINLVRTDLVRIFLKTPSEGENFPKFAAFSSSWP
jgi:hypothetical protein